MNNIKEKIKTNFTKNKIYILAFLVIWIITVSITLFAYKDTLGKESSGNSVYDHVAYFYNNEIVQTVDTVDESKTISLFLSISKKDNSNIYVKVVGKDSGFVYGEKRIKDRRIQNDSYNAVVLDSSLDIKKDKKVNIIITSENEKDNNLGIWYSKVSPFGDNTLSINGETIEGNITAKFLSNNTEFKDFNNIIVSFAIVGGILVILYMLLFEPKKEKLFTILVIFMGLIYIVMITPISGPDEDYHYKQTLRLSNKIMFKEDVSLIEDLYLDYENLTTQTNNGRGYKRIIDTISKPMEKLEGRPMVSIPESSVYPYSLCYFPYAIGITIARIFRMNFINTYYLGRLFNLLFYALCVYISVKNTSVLKNAFGIVALFPMLIQQAITYTQDAWICALSMVIFAYALKWKFSETKIEKKDFVIVLITILLLAPAKYIYSLFATILLIGTSKNTMSKKTKIILIVLLLVPTIYAIGSNILSRIIPIIKNPSIIHQGTGDDLTIEEILEINPKYSIRYILMFPQKTIQLVIHTIKTRLKTWVCTSVGRALSGGTLLVPLEIIYGFMGIAIIAALQKENNILSIGNKIFIAIVCLAVVGLVMASMLVGWTRYDDEIIQGIQGRYFSPTIIYLLSTLNNKKIQIPQKIDKYLILIDLILSFETIIYVLSFTFVN